MRKSRSDVRLQTRKYLFLIPGSAKEEKDRNPERKAKARPRVNESRGTRETNPGMQMDEQTPKESTHESVVEVNSVYFVCYRLGGCCRQSPIESQGRVAGGPWGQLLETAVALRPWAPLFFVRYEWLFDLAFCN